MYFNLLIKSETTYIPEEYKLHIGIFLYILTFTIFIILLSYNKIYIIIIFLIFLGILIYDLNDIKKYIKINNLDNIEFDLLKDLEDIDKNISTNKNINNDDKVNDDFDDNMEPKKYDIVD